MEPCRHRDLASLREAINVRNQNQPVRPQFGHLLGRTGQTGADEVLDKKLQTIELSRLAGGPGGI